MFNEEKIPITNIYTIFSKIPNISKWQIIQRKIDKLDILILCAGIDKSIIREKLINDLSIIERKGININIKFTENLKGLVRGRFHHLYHENKLAIFDFDGTVSKIDSTKFFKKFVR